MAAEDAPSDGGKAWAPGGKAAPKSGAQRTVEITDIVGQPAGYSITLGPAPAEPEDDDPKGIRTLAKRIKSWTPFQVDGQPYEFSELNALALLNRFPYITDQLRDPE